LEVDAGRDPDFRNLALVGAVLARSNDPACQLTRDPADPVIPWTMGATRRRLKLAGCRTQAGVRTQDASGDSANHCREANDRVSEGQRPFALHPLVRSAPDADPERAGHGRLPGAAIAGPGIACQERARERIDDPATISTRNRHALAIQASGGCHAYP
jgi:hypothetical protein